MFAIKEEITKINLFSPPKQYTKSILEIVCKQLAYKFGSIIELVEQDKGEMFSSYNLPDEYLEKANQQAPVLFSPSGEAIKTGKIVIVYEPLKEPRLIPWHELMKPHDIQTIIWVPLLNQGKAFGTLILYDTKKRTISKKELSYFIQLELILSIAIASNKYVCLLNEQKYKLSQEIIERKSTQEKLKLSEQQFRYLSENSSSIIARFDKQMRYIYINPAGEKLFQMPFHSIMQKNNKELGVEENTVTNWEKELQKVFKEKKSRTIEIEYLTKKKAKKIFHSQLIPETTSSGVVENVICISTDITEYNKMKEEQLKASKLDSIGILAGGIAHDFNNILTVILGNISFAKISSLSKEKMLKRLEEIEGACLQAKNLTNQLLTFSKGGIPIKKVSLVPALVKEAVVFALRGSNIKYDFSIEQDILLAEVDVGQINQVINNLVINAKQAMPIGGTLKINIRKTLYTEKEKLPLENKNQDYILISITDEGTGIPQACLEQIFDPYFTTKKDGSGLGLAVTYSIIKKHNGHIEVSSVLNKGTTFFIYLPIALSQSPYWQSDNNQEIFLGKGRILLMDDQEIIRTLASEMLQKLGYQVTLAADGCEVIDLYQKSYLSNHPFDLIIIDLTVCGGMGGKETIKHLLQINPQVKAIVSSGYYNDPIMSSFQQHGFQAILKKPYTIHELSKILSEIINNS